MTAVKRLTVWKAFVDRLKCEGWDKKSRAHVKAVQQEIGLRYNPVIWTVMKESGYEVPVQLDAWRASSFSTGANT